MSSPSFLSPVVRPIQQSPVFYALIGLAVVAVAMITIKSSRPPKQASNFYEVKRGDFLVSIVEGGTLQSSSVPTAKFPSTDAYVDDIAKAASKHNIEFGHEYRVYRYNRYRRIVLAAQQ